MTKLTNSYLFESCYESTYGLKKIIKRSHNPTFRHFKSKQKIKYSGKLNGTPWLTVLRSLNLKTDGNRLWLLGRLGIERSFDIWLEHGFHTKRNLCVQGRMTVYTWVTRLPAELKASTRLSSTILVAVIAHLIPCLKGHTHK